MHFEKENHFGCIIAEMQANSALSVIENDNCTIWRYLGLDSAATKLQIVCQKPDCVTWICWHALFCQLYDVVMRCC